MGKPDETDPLFRLFLKTILVWAGDVAVTVAAFVLIILALWGLLR